MDLTGQIKQAEDNHRDAVKNMQGKQQNMHPSNVAPILAAQAVARDTMLSYCTLQSWIRASDSDFSDIDQ
jgi:hypothetical protein